MEKIERAPDDVLEPQRPGDEGTEEDVLDWDAAINVPPVRPGGVVTVRFVRKEPT